MQLIKEKHRSTGKDLKIKIPLESNINLNGLQQSINDYVERETGLSINPAIDSETYRFRRNNDEVFNFEFYSGVTYLNSLSYAGFTEYEIKSQADVIGNSFYLFQIYDSINSENQTLLHNSYYNGTSIIDLTSTYTIPSSDEFSNLYIPESFINESETNIIEVYGKFLFFNAKKGKLQVFINEENEGETSDEKLYHTINLFKSTKLYNIETSSGIINSKELDNSTYVDKVNESVDTFDNEKPNYPEGDQFNSDGTYTEVT